MVRRPVSAVAEGADDVDAAAEGATLAAAVEVAGAALADGAAGLAPDEHAVTTATTVITAAMAARVRRGSMKAISLGLGRGRHVTRTSVPEGRDEDTGSAVGRVHDPDAHAEDRTQAVLGE